MSGCEGCFNGCRDIVSDQCVKYTGSDIPSLEIEKGMPLSKVEEKIITYLQSVIGGTGVIPQLPETTCQLISDQLSGINPITLNDIILVLISAACDLQEQVDSIVSDVQAINATYDVSCITGAIPNSGAHAVLQSVIYQVCILSNNLTALYSLISTYVKINDINEYIEDYFSNIENPLTSTKMYLKMVPYVAVEYYGPIAGFDATGKGTGNWEQVYLCNGENDTPDKRGRIPIGCTSMGSFTSLDPAVQPGVNPTYNIPRVMYGSNFIHIAAANLPSHTHSVQTTINDPGHKHLFVNEEYVINAGYEKAYDITPGDKGYSNAVNRLKHFYTKNVNNTNTPQATGITANTTITGFVGSNQHIQAVPPVMSCYYIIHIPNPV